MSDTLINVENISKKYCRDLKKSLLYGVKDIISEVALRKTTPEKLRAEEFWSVNDVSFDLKRGECLGLIGPNGAGKSTLLKMLNGLIKPDKGRISIHGRVGALIELGAGFNPILTGRENIYVNGAILGFTKDEITRKFDEIVEFSEIHEFIDTPVQNYSSGMKVRLGFAVAAQMEPDVLLIDEVLAVGDVGFRAKCFNKINHILKKAAVIFVSHAMPEVSRACSEICVLNRGHIAYHGQDVPKGIELYYSTFAEEKSLVIGSGRAKVHKVLLESDKQTEVHEITYLDNLTVHLEVTVDSSVKFPCIGVTFQNQALQIVAQCYSHYNGFKYANSGKKTLISMDLGKINLNPGVYTLTMGIQAENSGEVLIKHNNFATLKIKGHFFGHAPTQIYGSWSTKVLG